MTAGGGVGVRFYNAEQVMALLARVYTDAYKSGHHYTVEGGYTDVFYVDRDTYWREHVEQEYAEDLAGLAPAPFAELLAADKEYDEANTALKVAHAIHGDYSSHADMHAAYGRFSKATARRASALAALEESK